MEVRVRDRRISLLSFAGVMLFLASSPAMGATVPGDAEVSSIASMNATRQAKPELGKSCVSTDPDFLCLGMKYVVYADEPEKPLISRQSVENNLDGINTIWNQCKIGFQVDEFVAPTPSEIGLPADTANFSDLDQIRRTFADESSLLLVTTYKWKRNGDLGRTPANAWTKMPGSKVTGIVMEQKVGSFPNIIAHELGHYLNLYHVEQKAEVMNAVIYKSSTAVSGAQCQTARLAVKRWWSAMVRR